MSSLPIYQPGYRGDMSFLGNRRLLFGHQSVGVDLLNGVRSLSESTSILELESKDRILNTGGILHFRVGTNGNPESKIDDFAERIVSRPAQYDIAAMKLCYVDINRHSDVEALFEYYNMAIKRVSLSAPHLHIIHVTVPLRSVRLGVRSRVRQLTGRSIRALDDNVQREKYNSLLRTAYPRPATLFDLALIESRGHNGTAYTCRYKGAEVSCMYPGFTNDGGHLNEAGAKTVATKFIETIDGLRSR